MGQNFSDRGLKKSIDCKLVITYLLLILIGWVNIYASIHSDGPSSIFDFGFRCGKQFVWILTALGLAALILFVCPARLWESTSFPLYLITLVLLVAVIFLGVEVKGSRSWFEFGPVRFQPAEVSKITTSLLLATLMSQSGFRIDRFRDLMLTALVIGVPMLVILGESETGSALVYAGFIFVMYREGFSGWWIAAIGIAILMFVLTLTASPYTAMMVLIGILIACICTQQPQRFNVIIASTSSFSSSGASSVGIRPDRDRGELHSQKTSVCPDRNMRVRSPVFLAKGSGRGPLHFPVAFRFCRHCPVLQSTTSSTNPPRPPAEEIEVLLGMRRILRCRLHVNQSMMQWVRGFDRQGLPERTQTTFDSCRTEYGLHLLHRRARNGDSSAVLS